MGFLTNIGVVSSTAAATDPFGYEAQAGYYTDQSTGLILTTFRYYDPGAGRFLNRDPISYSGGMNVYGYCGNDAENRSDPSGLDDMGFTDPWQYLGQEFDNMSPADWLNDLQNTSVYKAGVVLANIASFIPLPENPVFDERIGLEAIEIGGAAAPVVKEGIYEITTAMGEKYIGQSGNIDRRLAQHVAGKRFTQAEANAAQRTQVLGGKTAREIAEQMKIIDNGGPKGGQLLNKRNAVGATRKCLMPQSYQSYY